MKTPLSADLSIQVTHHVSDDGEVLIGSRNLEFVPDKDK